MHRNQLPVRDDPRRFADVHTCEACEAYLEADDNETVPDGDEFATASELRADGSGHVCDACGDSFRTLTRLRYTKKTTPAARDVRSD